MVVCSILSVRFHSVGRMWQWWSSKRNLPHLWLARIIRSHESTLAATIPTSDAHAKELHFWSRLMCVCLRKYSYFERERERQRNSIKYTTHIMNFSFHYGLAKAFAYELCIRHPHQPASQPACQPMAYSEQWINAKLFEGDGGVLAVTCTDFTSLLCRCHHKIPQKCAHWIYVA